MQQNGKKVPVIVYFCNVDWFLVSHRINLVQRAVKLGYDVHIICARTKRINELDSLPVTIHDINLRRGGLQFLNFASSLISFYLIIKTIRPDIVHCITSKPNIIGSLINYFTHIPKVIIAISGFGIITTNKGTLNLIRRKILFLYYKFIFKKKNIEVIVQNEEDFSICKSLMQDSKKLNLIKGSGVDLQKFKPANEGSLIKKTHIILFASRLLITKGIETFLEIAQKWKYYEKDNLLPNVKFHVAGKFDTLNPDCIKEHIIKDSVERGIIEYKGDVTDMVPILQDASILVFPTTYGEGLPKIICEAASVGVPTIATDIAGCREGIINRKTGILMVSQDIDLYIKEISLLLQNDYLLKNMTISSRKYAEENFDMNLITEKHFDIYFSN